LSTLFASPAVFEFEGVKYTYKRLGHKQVFMLLGLGKELWSMGLGDFQMRMERFEGLLTQATSFSQEAVMNISLVFGLEYMKASFDEFILTILRKVEEDGTKVPVTQEELNNEDLFPANTLPLLIFNLLSHPDISMFINAFSQAKEIPFFQMLKQNTEAPLNT
jgi:hypothetical protein